ncbi:Fes1-domain-containing protein [Viridothelium virens]|uniref:Fes1-domain-containing protein n=1 Tax=Viridothelium virens TaxID=1048519 RepID=A0A6A6GUG5_VIRVR|nr:Fes1-domain-containing protein [Viridothelium virens]
MNDPGLNSLLKWSIENSSNQSDSSTKNTSTAATYTPNRGPDPSALASLLGGPSDAELMKSSMVVITSPSTPVPARRTAFDNFEQLIENLDNANNMSVLGLWVPLLQQLNSEDAEVRNMAIACVRTAVQNNLPTQEKALEMGAVPILIGIALRDQDVGVRKRAVRALSAEIRNFQVGLDAFLEGLRVEGMEERKVDAGDMQAVDELIEKLLERTQRSE